jgi:DNA-binding transcriptional MerR regulator
MTTRSYLSIGDVLTLLRQEFPDVTISKIRFLESQGLVNPERTPSGYRKFYEQDVERLRWVLRQQREHFLPLKVIKDRLGDDAEDSGSSSLAAGATAPSRSAPSENSSDGQPSEEHAHDLVDESALVTRGARSETGAAGAMTRLVTEGATLPGIETGIHAVAGPGGSRPSHAMSASSPNAPNADAFGMAGGLRSPSADRPVPPGRVEEKATTGADRPTTPAAKSGAGSSAGPSSGRRDDEPVVPAVDRPTKTSKQGTKSPARPSPSPAAKDEDPSVGGGDRLSIEELSAACELDVSVLLELQEFGLLCPKNVAGLEYFDEGSLAVATLAAHFARFGIEPRHLRLYKNAADREAGFVEQILLPLVRQRNPEALARAEQTADELAGLGQQLRSALLRRALADLLYG